MRKNNKVKKNDKNIKIQFGSGGNIKPGFINVDFDKTMGADVAWNMEEKDYPFPDNYADHILCEMTLEHIRTPSLAIDEFHRIIKPNGTIKIIVPHFSQAYSLFADIHVSQFNVGYFYGRKDDNKDVFGKNNPEGKWKFISKRFKEVDVELIFPKGYLIILSLPWQLIFGKNKILQGIYESLFSTIYRACEIHVTLKRKVD